MADLPPCFRGWTPRSHLLPRLDHDIGDDIEVREDGLVAVRWSLADPPTLPGLAAMYRRCADGLDHLVSVGFELRFATETGEWLVAHPDDVGPTDPEGDDDGDEPIAS